MTPKPNSSLLELLDETPIEDKAHPILDQLLMKLADWALNKESDLEKARQYFEEVILGRKFLYGESSETLLKPSENITWILA